MRGNSINDAMEAAVEAFQKKIKICRRVANTVDGVNTDLAARFLGVTAAEADSLIRTGWLKIGGGHEKD